MPPFRHLAVAVTPPAATAPLIAYSALMVRLLAPQRIRLIVPAGASTRAESDTESLGASLPPALVAARDAGILTIAETRGDLLDVILRETVAMHADLLLVGTEPAGVDRRMLVRRLAMGAPCSVWMVPADARAEIARILVPVDFSARSADALEVGTSLAAATGASCAAVHVRFDPTLAAPEAAIDAVLGREHQAFNTFAARTDLHGVDVEHLLDEGRDVSRVILRVAAAHQADLLVMGTRGRTRAASLLIGSETEHTLQESGPPVLAVKHFGARLRFVEALLDPRVRDREGPRFG